MSYQIYHVSDTDGWISIVGEDSFFDCDAFVKMVKQIADSVHGKIVNVGEMQYRVTNVPFDLIFQWDDCFGIVVIPPSPQLVPLVIDYLTQFDIVLTIEKRAP